jgi:lysophospholipase L1-like esterase
MCGVALAVPAGGAEPRAVFVLGDSVTVGATPSIDADAAANGWTVTIDAQIGRTTDTGASILASMQGHLPDYVVVELGNNDGANPATLAARVDAVMHELVGVRHVVWFNLSPFASWVPVANEVLQSATQRFANLVLADWATIAESTPGALWGSGPHLQEPGAQAFAALVYREIDALARTDAAADRPAPAELASHPVVPLPDRAPAVPVPAPEVSRAALFGFDLPLWGHGRPVVDTATSSVADTGGPFCITISTRVAPPGPGPSFAPQGNT